MTGIAANILNETEVYFGVRVRSRNYHCRSLWRPQNFRESDI